jgi:hypothetical protein
MVTQFLNDFIHPVRPDCALCSYRLIYLNSKSQILCELSACIDVFSSSRVMLKRRSNLRHRFNGFEDFEDYLKAHPDSHFRFDVDSSKSA